MRQRVVCEEGGMLCGMGKWMPWENGEGDERDGASSERPQQPAREEGINQPDGSNWMMRRIKSAREAMHGGKFV